MVTPSEKVQLYVVGQDGRLIEDLLENGIKPSQQVIDTQLQNDPIGVVEDILSDYNHVVMKESKNNFRKLLDI